MILPKQKNLLGLSSSSKDIKCVNSPFSSLLSSRVQNREYARPAPPTKASKSSPEIVQEQIELLMEMMPLRAKWAPVDKFVELSGITTLLQVS